MEHINVSLVALKRQAKKLKKCHGLAYLDALDQLARAHGFDSWALLQHKYHEQRYQSVIDWWQHCLPGRLYMLVAAAGVGKVSLICQLLTLPKNNQKKYCYCTLVTPVSEIAKRIANHSDSIEFCHALQQALQSSANVLIIDYLQAFSPDNALLLELKKHAQKTNKQILFLAQINKTSEPQSSTLDLIDGGKQLARHFHQVILLQGSNEEPRTVQCLKGDIPIVKTHYSFDKNQCQFDL